MRKEYPILGQWFDAMEKREAYQGTQSDFNTHVHDLPPQMGGCYFKYGTTSTAGSQLVDNGPFFVNNADLKNQTIPEVNPESNPYRPGYHELEALSRVCKYFSTTEKVNPVKTPGVVDIAMRTALTEMLYRGAKRNTKLHEILVAEEGISGGVEKTLGSLPVQSDVALCYVRDRIS